MLIYKYYYNLYCCSYTQKFQVLMKLESCIILQLFFNFSDSEPEYSYKVYSYKKVCTAQHFPY